jgi:hypothetical protein
MADTKETIQKNIDEKNKQLDALKANILKETIETKKNDLETQKKRLEDELIVLQNQLNELEKLEQSTATTETDKEKKALKNDIEPDNDRSYEIIK